MLRLAFTAQDLLRTRLAPEPAPLMELGFALAILQRHDVLFERWRRATRPLLPSTARPLFDLVPPSAAGPLFLDPISDGLEDGLDAVLSTPTPVVGAELRRVVANGPISPWVRALDARDADAWTVLADAVRAAHEAVLVEMWPRVRACYRAEVALRGRVWAAGGVRAVLGCVHPGTTWDGDTLQIPARSDLRIDLGGLGVTLMPSVLWRDGPLFGRHPDGSLLILYPAATPLPLSDTDPSEESIAGLLGGTRALILALTAATRTTTELARAAGISAASASQHTKILRAAGLITTSRDGKAVLHSLTPLGDLLLANG